MSPKDRPIRPSEPFQQAIDHLRRLDFAVAGKMSVEHGGLERAMPQPELNEAQVDAIFQQMVAHEWRSVWIEACLGMPLFSPVKTTTRLCIFRRRISVRA